MRKQRIHGRLNSCLLHINQARRAMGTNCVFFALILYTELVAVWSECQYPAGPLRRGPAGRGQACQGCGRVQGKGRTLQKAFAAKESRAALFIPCSVDHTFFVSVRKLLWERRRLREPKLPLEATPRIVSYIFVCYGKNMPKKPNGIVRRSDATL